MSIVLAWQVPPPAKYEQPRQHAQRSVWRRCTDELRAHPGEWALVCKDEVASYARESCARMLRKYGCQVRTRTTTDDGLISVWARWPVENPPHTFPIVHASDSVDS